MKSTLTRDEKRLLRDLRSPDAGTRLMAAHGLNQSAHPQILEGLRHALTDESSDVAEMAAQSLAIVGDITSVELVVGAADRSAAPWPRVRRVAARLPSAEVHYVRLNIAAHREA